MTNLYNTMTRTASSAIRGIGRVGRAIDNTLDNALVGLYDTVYTGYGYNYEPIRRSFVSACKGVAYGGALGLAAACGASVSGKVTNPEAVLGTYLVAGQLGAALGVNAGFFANELAPGRAN
jgi:hypothetical protein